MTLLDKFAESAMHGLVADGRFFGGDTEDEKRKRIRKLAETAWLIAQVMCELRPE